MMGRNLKSRVARLEERRSAKDRPPYVYHVSKPPKPDELAAIEGAKSAGHSFIVAPWPCATVEEWLMVHGRPAVLQ